MKKGGLKAGTQIQQNLIMGNKLIRLHMDTAVALVSPGVRLTLPVGVYRRQWRHRVLIEGRLGRHPCQVREGR